MYLKTAAACTGLPSTRGRDGLPSPLPSLCESAPRARQRHAAQSQRTRRREHAPALRELHLSTNGIGSEGVRALAELCHPSPKLAALSLHDNRISDEGVFALADAISGGSFVVEKVTLHTNPAVSAEGVRRMTEACAGADFAEPTPDRGPTPYIPLDHTPQRWLERGDVDK